MGFRGGDSMIAGLGFDGGIELVAGFWWWVSVMGFGDGGFRWWVDFKVMVQWLLGWVSVVVVWVLVGFRLFGFLLLL